MRRRGITAFFPDFQAIRFVLLFWMLSPLATIATDAPALRGYVGIHDPSTIIKCNDRYYLFGTGPGIRSKSSADKIFWEAGPPVFSTPPAWTTNAVPGFTGTFWAPDIFYFNGRYCLYYSVSTWGSQVSAIGLVTNPTLDPTAPDYQWTDHGPVIQSSVGSPYNTIDPNVMVDAAGAPWMVFGSYWNGIYLVQLDPLTGLRLAPDSPMYRLADNSSIEASCLFYRNGYYYLFVNWGSCCSGVKSTYSIRVGRSTAITGPYLDRNGSDMRYSGGTLFLEGTGKYVGPGHTGILVDNGADWFSYHYYDAGAWNGGEQCFGLPAFDLRPLSWTSDGWPAFTNDWSAVYNFDQDARDENGQYYGLLKGGARVQTDPIRGRVLALDGTNEFVQLPAGIAYARTFEITAKWNGGPAMQRLFECWGDSDRSFFLTPKDETGVIQFAITNAGSVRILRGPAAMPINAWTDLAVTLDGTRAILYVNGNPVSTNSSFTLSPRNILAQTNYLGRAHSPTDPYFRGQIDRFRVHGRCLSRAELGTPAAPASPAHTWTSFYPFTTGAQDASNRFHGILYGGASIQTDTSRGPVLNLSGASQYAGLPASIGAMQTLAGWVKWNGGSAWQRMFDFGRDSTHWIMLTPMDGGGKMRCAITTDRPTFQQVIQAPDPLPTGVWTHVAVVFDGRQGILYTNGHAIAVNHSVNLLPSDVSPTRNYLGRSQYSHDPWFSGRLDSLKISFEPLTPAEFMAPTATIKEPIAGAGFAIGDRVSFVGAALDYSDAPLPASAFRWSAAFHRSDQVLHFFGPVAGVTNGSFPLPSFTPVTTDDFYRLNLLVTDAAGYEQIVSRDILLRPPLRLELLTDRTTLQLSWPSWAADMKLYTTPALSPPVSWTLVTNIPATFNGSQVLTLPVTGPNRFFRGVR